MLKATNSIMHLSHAEVGFHYFLQSLFAVTCHSTRLAMQAILPALALSLYLTDRGDDDADNGGDGGDGDNGRVAEALLLLVVGRYSIQVGRMWRVFYLNFYTTIFLWLRRIVIISTTSPGKIFG